MFCIRINATYDRQLYKIEVFAGYWMTWLFYSINGLHRLFCGCEQHYSSSWEINSVLQIDVISTNAWLVKGFMLALYYGLVSRFSNNLVLFLYLWCVCFDVCKIIFGNNYLEIIYFHICFKFLGVTIAIFSYLIPHLFLLFLF